MQVTNILSDLTARGLVAQATPALAEHLKNPRTLYCGFDPTADSLHIGSLVPLLALRRFQLAGHTPIIVVGGATGMIGDPSFKAQERKLNDESTIKGWVEKLKQQTSRFVDFDRKGNPAKMANNYDWTQGVGILSFLRDIGKHFSVNNLIGKEAIKARLEREDSGISYTEFTYPLLQAFDFQQLFKLHDCSLQIGGSDQWGNMTAGTELIRKTLQGEAHVMTLPLVTKSDGTKFGKTESGTIWLSAEKTSPYEFYQFWLNTSDEDLLKFYRYFSFQDIETINSQFKSANFDKGQTFESGQDVAAVKKLKMLLAAEITLLVHGAEECQKAIANSIVFNTSFEILVEDEENLETLATSGFPTEIVHLKTDGFEAQNSQIISADKFNIIYALLVTNLASSKREARDFLKGNAVQLNGEVVTDEKLELTKTNAKFKKYHLLKRGKRNFALLVLE